MCSTIDKLDEVIDLAVKSGNLYCAQDVYEKLKVYEARFSRLGIKLQISTYLSNGTIFACDIPLFDGLEVHTVERPSDTRKVIGANPIQATSAIFKEITWN